MRTVWLCLLIALLPLRLWAGGAMLVQHNALLQTTAPTAVQVAETEHPCHTPASLAEAPSSVHIDHCAGGEERGTDHLGCSACDICHTLAHPWLGAWLPQVAAPHAPPAHRAASLASARLTPAFKPPIV